MQRTIARRPETNRAVQNTGTTFATARASRLPAAESWAEAAALLPHALAAPSAAVRAKAPAPTQGHDFRRLAPKRGETQIAKAPETEPHDGANTTERETTEPEIEVAAKPESESPARESVKVAREPNSLTPPADPPTAPGTPTDPANNADPMDGRNTGSTTMPATVTTTYDVGGATLADVSANLPADEAGNAHFAIGVSSTTGDPITSANAQVTHSIQLPHWTERDTQCANVKAAWDRFLAALTSHENGHIALSRGRLGSVHSRFVGIPLANLQSRIDSETVATQAAYDAYDASNNHGLTGTPPTILDTSVVCPPPAAPDGGTVAPKSIHRAESADIEGGADVSHIVKQGLSGGGQPLDSATRAFMEPRLGQDLSGIRIHTGSPASTSAEQVNARAYAVGGDIAFRDGEYNPGTSAGRHLLAHELAHTVQQGATKPLTRFAAPKRLNRNIAFGTQRKMEVSQPGDPSEVEADQIADAVMRMDVPERELIAPEVGREPVADAVQMMATQKVQRDDPPAPGGTPPATPAPGAAPSHPTGYDPSVGLVYLHMDRWTLLSEKTKSITLLQKDVDVRLASIPIPDFGAFNVNFKASIGSTLVASYGPIVAKDISIGVTPMTALVVGGLAGVTALDPGAFPLLMLALKGAHARGTAAIEAPAKINGDITAGCSLEGVVSLLGTDKLDIAKTAFGLNASVGAGLEGNADGRVELVLDNGHLTFNSAGILTAKATASAKVEAFAEASILFGLIKGRLNKRWNLVDGLWSAKAKQIVGNEKLAYDWPGFKDEDKIVTIDESTVRSVIDALQSFMETDKTDSTVTDKEKLNGEGAPDPRTPEQKQENLDQAIDESDALLDTPEITALEVRGALPQIKQKYRLSSLELFEDTDSLYYVEGVVNPVKNSKKHHLEAAAGGSPTGQTYLDPANPNQLAPQWQGQVRKEFYGGSYEFHRPTLEELDQNAIHDVSLTKEEREMLRDPENFLCPGYTGGRAPHPYPHVMPKVKGQIDHVDPVVAHWNDGGNNMTQEERVRWYRGIEDPDNFKLLCNECNNAKSSRNSAGVKESPTPIVGPNFSGPDGVR